MATYKTPGVSIEEIAKLPPSIAEVETAIPAFIGYTLLQGKSGNPVKQISTGIPSPATVGVEIARITSLLEYETFFGKTQATPITVSVLDSMEGTTVKSRTVSATVDAAPVYTMYYHMQLYFANGGGPCYIVSVAPQSEGGTIDPVYLKAGLDAIKKYDEPTLLVFPEGVNMPPNPADPSGLATAKSSLSNKATTLDDAYDDLYQAQFAYDADTSDPKTPALVTALNDARVAYVTALEDYNDAKDVLAQALAAANAELASAGDLYDLYDNALAQAASLKDRFVIMDCHNDNADTLRDASNGLGNNNLKYGAAYHPFVNTILGHIYSDDKITIDHRQDTNGNGNYTIPVVYGGSNTLQQVSSSLVYNAAIQAASNIDLTLNPSAAIAGVYAAVDNSRGVWKAPANVSLSYVSGPTKPISDLAQESLNVDADAGKSINAIRFFTGKGTLVWGARTLAGNDNEWRYVPVRRFFNMVEESTKKATGAFVFEPNDANTWTKVQGMIENYLLTLWRAGALQGAKPEHAFYVSVGLGKTMTAQDILEGRMYVEIGMAVVRPAEFIILQFSHMMAQS